MYLCVYTFKCNGYSSLILSSDHVLAAKISLPHSDFLRSTMREECINIVLLLHVHNEETNNLDLTEVDHLFVSANN